MMPTNIIVSDRAGSGWRLAAIAIGSVNRESMKPWEFWIDVGGTFTDCIACSPEDDLVPLKVLSSAVTKGQVQQIVGTDRLVDLSRTSDPADFWVGYPLRCLDRDGRPLLEATVTAELSYYHLDHPSVRDLVDTQVWWYDIESERWYLDSAFPPFADTLTN